jgi:hypothetical protein
MGPTSRELTAEGRDRGPGAGSEDGAGGEDGQKSLACGARVGYGTREVIGVARYNVRDSRLGGRGGAEGANVGIEIEGVRQLRRC